MIVVNLMGGLGNQMFQYATAKRLSLSLKTELRIDVSGFGRNTRNREHTYQLGQFNIQASHATSADLLRFGSRKRRHFRFIPALRKWGFHRRERTSGTNFYEEAVGSSFKPEILELRNDAYLYGYFNSYKYFDSIRKELLPEYTPKSGLTDGGRRAESLIEKTGSISIHFRRGDYIDEPDIRKGVDGIITESYFRNALAAVIEKTPDPHLFVFSDDIAWVKESHSFPCDVTFVDFNPPQRGYEDLWLMSRCRHNITAGGSTFSWWAAYLNPNKDKIVVRTKDVNNDPQYNHPSDYFPPEWVTVLS